MGFMALFFLSFFPFVHALSHVSSFPLLPPLFSFFFFFPCLALKASSFCQGCLKVALSCRLFYFGARLQTGTPPCKYSRPEMVFQRLRGTVYERQDMHWYQTLQVPSLHLEIIIFKKGLTLLQIIKNKKSSNVSMLIVKELAQLSDVELTIQTKPQLIQLIFVRIIITITKIQSCCVF